MANTKISGLPSAASLTGVELLPAVQSGSTTQATVNQVKTYVNTTPAITGGSINSTTIGATTPSTGAFTSLSASGSISSTSDAYIHGVTVGLGGGSVATNTAAGANALYYNTAGNYNAASGYIVLYTNTTGSFNTASGAYSMYYNTAGVQNTANGTYSLFSNTTGSNNTAIGLQAGYGAAGVNANTTGSNNTFLGYATVGAGAADTNEIVIGANAVGLGSNTTVIGSASTTMSNIKGRVLIGTTTDDGVNALQVNGTVKATSIKFANTGGTKQALDYYEEGTWTPTYTSFTFGGSQTKTGNTYTRVGRLVTITGTITDTISTISAAGTSNIDLPFSCATGVDSTCTVVNSASGVSLGVGWIRSSNSKMYFPGFSTSGVNQPITWSATYLAA